MSAGRIVRPSSSTSSSYSGVSTLVVVRLDRRSLIASGCASGLSFDGDLDVAAGSHHGVVDVARGDLDVVVDDGGLTGVEVDAAATGQQHCRRSRSTSKRPAPASARRAMCFELTTIPLLCCSSMGFARITTSPHVIDDLPGPI